MRTVEAVVNEHGLGAVLRKRWKKRRRRRAGFNGVRERKRESWARLGWARGGAESHEWIDGLSRRRDD